MFVERSSVFIILLYLVIPMISSGQVKLSNDPAKIDFARPRNPVQNSLTTYSNFSGHNADFSRSLPKSISTDSTQVEWINQYNSELIPSSDIATGIAQDIAGNIYVTGQSIGINTSLDFLTIKYTSSGEKVWEARYDGPDHKDDSPVDIGVDSEGNIYVTGTSVQEGVPGTSDYVTLKYDQTGALQWAVRYDGPDQANDKAVALTLDSLGNIYVTGSSYYSETATDFVTIKYSTNGDQLWVSRFESDGYYIDTPAGIATDDLGGVYVSGTEITLGSDEDYLTVKYDASTGAELWSAFHDQANQDDRVAGLAVDDSGNVFVSGTSFASEQWSYLTIKYDSDGFQKWVNTYSNDSRYMYNARSMDIDNVGNIYITGRSYLEQTKWDYTTVKLNAQGETQWASVYNGPANENDTALMINADSAGNVYVTGVSSAAETNEDYTTIKYDSNGTEIWVGRQDNPDHLKEYPRGQIIDKRGNIYLTGYSKTANTRNDYNTIKYSSDGILLWDAIYNGPSHSLDYPVDQTLDDAGNIYVLGKSYTANHGTDFLILKYSLTGNVLWSAQYNSTGGQDDEPVAFRVDNSGNIVVTGTSKNDFLSSSISTVKYNSEGTLLWTSTYIDSIGIYMEAKALDIDNSGNIYIAGDRLTSNSNILTIKYDTNGNELWEAEYDDSRHSDNLPVDIEVDLSGNVYVSGASGPQHLNSNFTTIKYSSTGNEEWVKMYDGPAEENDEVADMVLDNEGNIYITGHSKTINNGYSFTTIKYNTDGVVQWIQPLHRSETSNDLPRSIALDQTGNVYVSGSSYTSATNEDFLLVKYNASGDEQWSAIYNSQNNWHETLSAMALDSEGNAYLTGTERESVNADNFLTIKISHSGLTQWVASYHHQYDIINAAQFVTVDSAENVYVTGFTGNDYTYNMMTTIKYHQEAASTRESNDRIPTSFALSQNYPNPFNPATVIQYQVPEKTYVNLIVFNALGQEVGHLVNAVKPAGFYEVQFDGTDLPSGIYFARIQTGNFSTTKKMMLLK